MPKEEIVPDKTENTDEVYKKNQFINTYIKFAFKESGEFKKAKTINIWTGQKQQKDAETEENGGHFEKNNKLLRR